MLQSNEAIVCSNGKKLFDGILSYMYRDEAVDN